MLHPRALPRWSFELKLLLRDLQPLNTYNEVSVVNPGYCTNKTSYLNYKVQIINLSLSLKFKKMQRKITNEGAWSSTCSSLHTPLQILGVQLTEVFK